MITKTNYVDYMTCPRGFYYSYNCPDEAAALDDQGKKRIEEGKEINNYAYQYFPYTVMIKKNQDFVNIALQVELTKKVIGDSQAIAEASFKYEDLFCAVDLLVKNEDGTYDIYEVKGSNDVKKHLKEYIYDTTFQKYVLTQCGLKVRKVYILHLNKEYVRHGDIEPRKLLVPYPISDDESFEVNYKAVGDRLTMLRRLQKENKLPEYGNCSSDCPFFEHCHKQLPSPNVLDINNIKKAKAHSLIENDIITYEQVLRYGNLKLNNRQLVQLQTGINPSNNPHVDKEALGDYLHGLSYPIYHLDFETMNEAIPPFDGASPYQQIPFQYSLYIEHTPGGKLEHKEFLANKLDSERELAEQLCKDIPLNATSMAFNMSFEKTVIKHLAKKFPDLADHLMNIHDHLVDLIVPFKEAYYYDNKQGGSNSIKEVMPALCPEMENAYHELPVVHNGGEALTMFPIMLRMSPEEKEKTRKGMLEYCKLDTLSMVKVLNRLWKEIK